MLCCHDTVVMAPCLSLCPRSVWSTCCATSTTRLLVAWRLRYERRVAFAAVHGAAAATLL